MPQAEQVTAEKLRVEDLEDLVGDAVCHIFRGPYSRSPSGISLCGVPRSEQPIHGGVVVAGTLGRTPFCGYCGARMCPECVRRAHA